MKIKRFHIGNLILQKVEEKKINKKKFAESIGIQRQNINKSVFEKHSIDTDLLCTISEVLECNFFDYFSTKENCNQKNYINQEVKATVSIQVGSEKKNNVIRFLLGENGIEILECLN